MKSNCCIADSLNTEQRWRNLIADFDVIHELHGVSPWDALEVSYWVNNGAASHGQKVIGQFLLAVWDPSVEVHFKLAEAVNVLPERYRNVIARWIMDPFWP